MLKKDREVYIKPKYFTTGNKHINVKRSYQQRNISHHLTVWSRIVVIALSNNQTNN